MSQTKFGPSITLFRMYERTSAKGNTYLAGSIGFANVVAFRSAEPNDKGQYTWEFKVQERPERRDTAAPAGYDRQPDPAPADPRRYDRELEDPIPF